MLYIAIVMILVGVLCFVYVSLAPAPQAVHPPQAGDSETYDLGRRKGKLTESDLKESLYQSRNQNPHSNKEREERILRERDFSHEPPPAWVDEGEAEFSEPNQNVAYTKPAPIQEDPPEIIESVTILGSNGENLEPAPEEKLIVKGLLFLDSKGKLPLDKQEFSALDLSEEAFQELRRIGEGGLLEESGKLIFRVKNISYTYEPRDLREVVFYDEAVVFLPTRNDYATVVFFTEGTEEIRAFFAQAAGQNQTA